MRHWGITAATAIPATDTKAMMKEKALVAWMFRHDMAERWQEVRPQWEFLLEKRKREENRKEKKSIFRTGQLYKPSQTVPFLSRQAKCATVWPNFGQPPCISIHYCVVDPISAAPEKQCSHFMSKQSKNESGGRGGAKLVGGKKSIQSCVSQKGPINKQAIETDIVAPDCGDVLQWWTTGETGG